MMLPWRWKRKKARREVIVGPQAATAAVPSVARDAIAVGADEVEAEEDIADMNVVVAYPTTRTTITGKSLRFVCAVAVDDDRSIARPYFGPK